MHIETSINQNFLYRTHGYNSELPNYEGIVLFPMGVTAVAQPGRIGGGYVILDGEKARTQNSNYRFHGVGIHFCTFERQKLFKMHHNVDSCL